MSVDNKKVIFGFWIYILSDCILFSILFAAFAVLHENTYGGPHLSQLTNLDDVFLETILLLTSSFTYGMAMMAMYRDKTKEVFSWLVMTFCLGSLFIGMELSEFKHIFEIGYSYQTSAALSSFFTLVGTHGLHVSIGLFWMLILIIQLFTFDMSAVMKTRLTSLGLFWAFLDVIWIFVFTLVYFGGG